MKRIVISESQYRLIKEFQDELTYYKFYTNVLSFLKDLLANPSNAQPSDILTNHGITRDKLIQCLVRRGVVTRNNKVTELEGENGKQESKMLVKYNVLRKDFEKKLHRLHIELCECTKPSITLEKLEEDDILDEEGSVGGMSCGFAMQGGGAYPNQGQYDVPMGNVQKREFWYQGNKQNKKKGKKQ